MEETSLLQYRINYHQATWSCTQALSFDGLAVAALAWSRRVSRVRSKRIRQGRSFPSSGLACQRAIAVPGDRNPTPGDAAWHQSCLRGSIQTRLHTTFSGKCLLRHNPYGAIQTSPENRAPGLSGRLAYTFDWFVYSPPEKSHANR